MSRWGGEAGPRLGLRCQERPSEPARQLLQRLRGLAKSTQGSETHRWRGLSHVPSCACSAFRKSSRRGCGLSPRIPGPLRTHTSVGGWWRHPRPPPPPHTRQGQVRLSGWTPLLQGPLRTPGRTPALGSGAGGAAALAQGPAAAAQVPMGHAARLPEASPSSVPT